MSDLSQELDNFLKQQVELARLIEELGLNPVTLFSGIVITPDMSTEELLEITGNIIEELAKQLKSE